MYFQETRYDRRDFTFDFVRGLCLPLMMIDHLRNHWLSIFTYRPLGFFCAVAVFVFLSGFALAKHHTRYLDAPDPFSVYRHIWRRAAEAYALHLLVSLITLSLALYVPFGREVEDAVNRPWKTLMSSALLNADAPLLEFLPMYIFFLLFTPWILKRFQSGHERAILGPSFLLWLAAQFDYSMPMPPFTTVLDGAGWQFLYVTSLYLGFRQATQPLEKPQESKTLKLALFGCMTALVLLRHAEIFGLEGFAQAIPAWWIDRSHAGPLTILNLYLWVAFLWLVPGPLVRLARQGRVFAAAGRYAVPVFAWQVLLLYIFMSWFPQLYRYSILEQALVVCFAVACLVFPVNLFLTTNQPRRRPISLPPLEEASLRLFEGR